jgi:hypothetical protein
MMKPAVAIESAVRAAAKSEATLLSALIRLVAWVLVPADDLKGIRFIGRSLLPVEIRAAQENTEKAKSYATEVSQPYLTTDQTSGISRKLATWARDCTLWLPSQSGGAIQIFTRNATNYISSPTPTAVERKMRV